MNLDKVIYPELSYTVNGILYFSHNNLGRFAKEKQHCDLIELKFKEKNIKYQREFVVVNTGNRVDFLVEDKIILEAKTVPFILHEDYYQIQRYLEILDLELGLLVNFRSRYLKPQRVLRRRK